MISFPLNVPDGRVSTLFPTAISSAYRYDGSYIEEDTLQPGIGYWLKFSQQESISITGTTMPILSVDVKQGWNMVGSPKEKIAGNQLVTQPCGIISSDYFTYSDSYAPADTLEPGKGYWIKVNEAGNLLERKWIKVASIYHATVTVHPTEPNILYAGTPSNFSTGINGAILRSTNWGSTWDTLVKNVDVGRIILDITNPNIGYASLGSANACTPGILKTTDGGSTWFHADSGLSVNWETGAGLIMIDPSNSEILYAETHGIFGGGLYKSIDGGRFWFPIRIPSSNNCTIDTQYFKSSPFTMAIDPQNSDFIYICPVLYGDSLLYRSIDGGISWEILHCFTKDDGKINSIHVNSRDSNIIYLDAKTFLRSSDRGHTWDAFNFGLPDSLLGVVTFPSNNPDVMYLQTFSHGNFRNVYQTTNGGMNWYYVSSDSGYTWIQALDEVGGSLYSMKLDGLYYPTEIDGIYRLKICK